MGKERREGGTFLWGQELQKRGERQRWTERQAEKKKVREKGRDRQRKMERERGRALLKRKWPFKRECSKCVQQVLLMATA